MTSIRGVLSSPAMISEGESRKGVRKRNKASLDAEGKIKAR